MTDTVPGDDGKVACTRCGARILPFTAAENEGRCVPCARATREDIGRPLRESEERRGSPDPLNALWQSLGERVFDPAGGFATLSEPEKRFYAATHVFTEIYNGGIEQYFFNHSGNYYNHAIAALTEMGDVLTLNALEAAGRILFPSGVPLEIRVRRDVITPLSDAESHRLDPLVATADLEGLRFRLAGFAVRHGLIKPVEPE